MVKTKDEWLVQMHVFPDQVNDPSDLEHDYAYAVEYNPADGKRRTVRLSDEEAAEIRAFNGLPAEKIVRADDDEGGE